MENVLANIKSNNIMWAIVNDRLEWCSIGIDHFTWLNRVFGVNQVTFENTIVGHIKNFNTGIVEICSYIGSGLDECEVDEKHIKELVMLADLMFDYSIIEIYTGVKKSKLNASYNKPSKLLRKVTKKDISRHLVSMLDMLKYEDMLVKMLNNRGNTSDTGILRTELNNIRKVINETRFNSNEMMDLNIKRRILTYAV